MSGPPPAIPRFRLNPQPPLLLCIVRDARPSPLCRVHPEYYPKNNPCGGDFVQTAAVFDGLVSYKNGMKGAIATQASALLLLCVPSQGVGSGGGWMAFLLGLVPDSLSSTQ